VRRGDECKIVFERRYADDRPAGYGQILFAEYHGKRTGKKTACLFNGEYHDENGVKLQKSYLRAPLNTLRITSGYGWRIHPVLNVWKMHTGVDYGAPTGTPIYAISNGTVSFQGCGEAYGLYVCIRHDNGRYGEIYDLSISASHPNVMYIAVVGGLYPMDNDESPSGVYRSTDYGDTWERKTCGIANGSIGSVHVLSDDPNTVVVSNAGGYTSGWSAEVPAGTFFPSGWQTSCTKQNSFSPVPEQLVVRWMVNNVGYESHYFIFVYFQRVKHPPITCQFNPEQV